MADYTQVYINNDMAKLNIVLQTLVTNGIVGAIEYTQDTYATFTFYADAEKTTEVFRITQAQGGISSTVKYTFKATASDGTSLSTTDAANSSGVTGYIMRYGYATSGGVLIGLYNTAGGSYSTDMREWFCITKNQDGNPVFIWTNNTSTSNGRDHILTTMNTEYIVASSDVAPLTTVSRLAPTYQKQTLISPFFSCCNSETVSYTPNAGRILAGDISNFIYDEICHVIVINGVTYLTNGYWVLKVG